MTTEFKMVPVTANVECGFDYVDGAHVPTIKISLPSCGPDDSLAWDRRDYIGREIRAMLAAAPASTQAAQPVAVVHVNMHGCRRAILLQEGMRLPADTNLYTHSDAAEVERQRQLKMILAERVENAEANCSVYRHQIEEQQALLQLGLAMINRGIVSFDDQIEYRQKLAALSTTAKPEADHDQG